MLRFFEFFGPAKKRPVSHKTRKATSALEERAVFDAVCDRLNQSLLEEHAELLAKIKTLQLIRQADPLPKKVEKAWREIRQQSGHEAAAGAELLIELQNLLNIGRSSKLW